MTLAVTAITIDRKNLRAEYTGDQQDKVVLHYLVSCNEPTNNPRQVVALAQVFGGPNEVPMRREAYPFGGNLYADKIVASVNEQHASEWDIEVEYSTPQEGDLSNFSLHPLMRPPSIKIDYIDKEFGVRRAYNLEEHGTNPASDPDWPYHRPVGEYGPITNSLGIETIDPVVETHWYGVLQIRRYVSNLDAVVLLNDTYQHSTNSDTVIGGRFGPRQLKYQVTQSSEEDEQDGIPFFEIITSIEILPTTDVYLNNVGYEYVGAGKKIVNFKDEDDEPVQEPKFLTLTGADSGSPILVGYRYLEPMPYFPLVS